MNYKVLSEIELSEIIDNVIQTVYSGKEWKDAFPDVIGYKYFIPEGHGDMEEHPDAFRGIDHAIAHKSVKYPELHSKIAELVKIITVGNAFFDEVILASIFEHAATHYAVELALVDKKYIKPYAEFLLTNDTYYERFQRFDFVRVVRKWGWCTQTYFLLFAYMLWEGEYFDEDVKYLNFNDCSLSEKIMDKKEEDIFLDSLYFFLKEINHDPNDEESNTFFHSIYSELVRKHIYSDNLIFPEERAKCKSLQNRFFEVVEKLKKEEFDKAEILSEIIEVEKPLMLNKEEDIPLI